MLRATPILIAPLLALLLSGCVALGEPFSESDLVGPPDQARVIIFRTKDSLQYSFRPTEIEIEGIGTAYCRFGGFLVQDVPPGDRLLLASMWDVPGSCGTVAKLEAGRTYLFEITPRIRSLVTGMVYWSNPLFGPLNHILYQSDRPCDGGFAIKRADDTDALEKLPKLRRSE